LPRSRSRVRISLLAPITFEPDARVVESVDTRDLKSLEGNFVTVQVRPRAPFWINQKIQCEYSSAGRARPCQGRGHEFEPRYSLQVIVTAEWQSGHAADCKSVHLGSTPGSASIIKDFHAQAARCPGGEIGRHKGFKIPRRQLRAGSSPAPGTIYQIDASIAQLVERDLAKVEVTSSNLVTRSK
jgi:hypothetical protein